MVSVTKIRETSDYSEYRVDGQTIRVYPAKAKVKATKDGRIQIKYRKRTITISNWNGIGTIRLI